MPKVNSVSIVVPTYQRKLVVQETLLCLNKVVSDVPVEVIVVVDGSSDGTAEAVSALEFKWPTKIIQQSNKGLAVSRNRGAKESNGDLIVFIDDDMRADQNFILAHIKEYLAGADAVVGRMTLDKKSPDTFIADDVEKWSDDLTKELSNGGFITEGHHIHGGHISILRNVFEELNGFNTEFTKDGSYGNEDLEFGDRLIAKGAKVAFSSEAITAQFYNVKASELLDRWNELASADELIIQMNSEKSEDILERQSSLKIKRPAYLFLIKYFPGTIRFFADRLRVRICKRVDAGEKTKKIKSQFYGWLRLYYSLGCEIR